MKDINKLLEVAKKCEYCEEYDLALKYYMAVLEISPNLQVAEIGKQRAKNELAKVVYYTTPASFKLSEGRLELRKSLLVYVSLLGGENEFLVEDIDNMKVSLGRLVFDYKGVTQDGYSCRVAKKWIEIINDAKEGKYPKINGGKLTTLEKYIHDNFTLEQKEEAILYFMDMSGCSSEEARISVASILN